MQVGVNVLNPQVFQGLTVVTLNRVVEDCTAVHNSVLKQTHMPVFQLPLRNSQASISG